ncbi:MAG: hypothetical protein AB1938_31015 [Myxococcota bacterium]
MLCTCSAGFTGDGELSCAPTFASITIDGQPVTADFTKVPRGVSQVELVVSTEARGFVPFVSVNGERLGQPTARVEGSTLRATITLEPVLTRLVVGLEGPSGGQGTARPLYLQAAARFAPLATLPSSAGSVAISRDGRTVASGRAESPDNCKGGRVVVASEARGFVEEKVASAAVDCLGWTVALSGDGTRLATTAHPGGSPLRIFETDGGGEWKEMALPSALGPGSGAVVT